MKCLIIKDFLILRGQLKTLLLVAAIWFVISFINGSGLFFMALSVVFSMLLPMNTITSDEKSGFERFAAAMPLPRGALALSRYVVGAACSALMSLAGIAAAIIIGDDPRETLISAALCFCSALCMLGVMLPLAYRLGVEKARIAMTVAFVVLFLAAALVASELGMEPGEGGAALAVLPLAAIVILAASMSVSLRIYAKKEF